MLSGSTPRQDFDSPWKQVLEVFFEEFVAFFFPDIYPDIDWQRGYEFLDTQLQQIVREAEVGTRYADKLVKVWRRSGDETWVFTHIEVQSQSQSSFAERLFTYYGRLRDRFNAPVASLAVLADSDPNWHPTSFSSSLWNCSVAFEFPTVKLLDYGQDWAALEASGNPFSIIVMAHLKTLATRSQPEERQQSKLSLVRALVQRGYERTTVLELLRFIDWMLTLPEERQEQFWQEVRQIEESDMAPYMMSFEHTARQEGKQEGRQEGRKEGRKEGRQEGSSALLIRQLNRKLGIEALHPASVSLIQSLSFEALQELGDAMFELETQVQLLSWLLQHPQPEVERPIRQLWQSTFNRVFPLDDDRFAQLADAQVQQFAERFLADTAAEALEQWLSEQ